MEPRDAAVTVRRYRLGRNVRKSRARARIDPNPQRPADGGVGYFKRACQFTRCGLRQSALQLANLGLAPLPSIRWSGEPIPVITARCGNLIFVCAATGCWLVNGRNKTGLFLSCETYSLTCFLSPRRGHALARVIKIRNRHPLASGFKRLGLGKWNVPPIQGLGEFGLDAFLGLQPRLSYCGLSEGVREFDNGLTLALPMNPKTSWSWLGSPPSPRPSPPRERVKRSQHFGRMERCRFKGFPGNRAPTMLVPPKTEKNPNNVFIRAGLC
jgi:hypothetical protein